MLPTPPQSPEPRKVCAPEDRLGQLVAGRLQLLGVLGVGAYGVVYSAVDVHTNVPYAVKTLNKVGLDQRQKTFQQREIELHMRASQHPNVVSMHKVLDSPDCTYVIMEYCPEGDLFTNITDASHYVGNDFVAKSIFLQILDAVEYCHAIGIYHRDLKPENILVTDGGMTAKLADFGLATAEYISTDFGCGSTFYMSPECQQTSPKPFACYAAGPNDVWSLGVILVNLTCGRNPWKKASIEDSTFAAFLRNSEFLKTILPITDGLDCILRRIFECDPSQRITIAELRSMILRCPAFTTLGSAQSLPSPPAESVQYEQYVQQESFMQDKLAFTTCHSQLATQFSHLTTSSRASGSHGGSVFSSPSPASSKSSSQSSYVYASAPLDAASMSPAPGSQVHGQCHYDSQSSGAWYMPFMPAIDLAHKHITFNPFFSGVRVL